RSQDRGGASRAPAMPIASQARSTRSPEPVARFLHLRKQVRGCIGGNGATFDRGRDGRVFGQIVSDDLVHGDVETAGSGDADNATDRVVCSTFAFAPQHRVP